MAWVRLDDQFFDHPKLLVAGPLATLLHAKAIAYCNRYLTDGFVPSAAVATMVSWEDVEPLTSAFDSSSISSEAVNRRLAAKLIDAGAWEKTDLGYSIHDYLEYQPSRKDVLKLRSVRSKNGSKGGESSGNSRRSKNTSNGLAVSFNISEAKSNPDPNPDPKKKEQEIITDSRPKPLMLIPRESAPSFDLEAVYSAFPRKEGKKTGLDRLRKQIKTPDDYQRLIRAVANYARSMKLEGREQRYIKQFSAWTSTWEDYVDLGLAKGPRDQSRDGYQVLE